MENHIEIEETKQDKGFTLVELLIVIVILGILATVTVFAVTGITTRGKASACLSDVKTIQTAEEAYNANNGFYGTEAQLVSGGLIARPFGQLRPHGRRRYCAAASYSTPIVNATDCAGTPSHLIQLNQFVAAGPFGVRLISRFGTKPIPGGYLRRSAEDVCSGDVNVAIGSSLASLAVRSTALLPIPGSAVTVATHKCRRVSNT